MIDATPVTEPLSKHAQVSKEIEEELLASLALSNAQSTNATIVLTKRDSSGKLLAGVSGITSYGWLLVKLLWVHEDHRKTGVGRTLMLEAESRAKELGCHGAWLDSSSSAARDFYVRLGYSEFGRLSNGPDHEPAQHRRWFMKKTL